jgi:hypothetical protein
MVTGKLQAYPKGVTTWLVFQKVLMFGYPRKKVTTKNHNRFAFLGSDSKQIWLQPFALKITLNGVNLVTKPS